MSGSRVSAVSRASSFTLRLPAMMTAGRGFSLPLLTSRGIMVTDAFLDN
ncbi:hypothetical protein [uncultured Butyricimonas sp.]|nr:hypothetical protein [uncultured Butyricimonas sp.]